MIDRYAENVQRKAKLDTLASELYPKATPALRATAMPSTPFDTYLRFAALTERLHAYAAQYPGLVRLESIGKSYEGRDIWLVSVTCFASGPAHEKPALWVDGNLHAAELVGSMACLYLLDALVRGYGNDADITRCLDTRAFYVCPRVNPDGAEWALADTPRLIRSSTRPYPYAEAPAPALSTEDIDGDGRILSMRVPDPHGAWKVAADNPRLMVPREPVEVGGQYYRLLPEGRLHDFDGHTLLVQDKQENLDLNRNFPGQWRGEHEQKGAGPYPASEPEVRAVVQFVSEHPTICNAIAFHSYSGVLLRPFSYQKDELMAPEDLWTFQKIGTKGTELTGYPAVSAYHDFQYHPRHVITGALDDWFYDERGGYAWTVEIWSPQREAGITDYKFIDWYRQHPQQDDEKLLCWSDSVLDGAGYIDWYPFEHPQLGRVELGGWNPLYSFWNPPPKLLEKEIARFPAWLVWHNLISPRLELREARVTDLGRDHFHITLFVQNSGWLPTYVTKKALEKKLTRGVICEIALPEGSRLVQGEARVECAQLEGRAYKPTSPVGWAGQSHDPTEDRLKVEWVVHAPRGGDVALCARHERAGVVRASIALVRSHS